VNIGLYYVKDGALLAKGIKQAYAAAKKSGGEVWLTEAFQYMVANGAKIKIEPVAGWYDTGTTEQTISIQAPFQKTRKVSRSFRRYGSILQQFSKTAQLALMSR
jgi:dTDP-glucose pyrophosphorylase